MILTINKRWKSLYNKTRKPTRKSLKRGNAKNVNKYVHVYYSFLILQLLYVCYVYLLITKLLIILIFAHGEHKKKIIRMYSILFYVRIHSYSNRCPWRRYDCNVVLVLFQRNDVITLVIYDAFVVNLRNIVIQKNKKTAAELRKESIKKKHKLNQSIQYLILFN